MDNSFEDGNFFIEDGFGRLKVSNRYEEDFVDNQESLFVEENGNLKPNKKFVNKEYEQEF